MVTFDHSRYDMFDNGNYFEKIYIGGIVGSINPNAWANPATPTMTATAIRQAFSNAPSTNQTPAN